MARIVEADGTRFRLHPAAVTLANSVVDFGLVPESSLPCKGARLFQAVERTARAVSSTR